MKYFTTAAALFAGVAVANYNITTETVTAYTTFCPEATTLTHGSSTITVTAVCQRLGKLMIRKRNANDVYSRLQLL